MGRNDSPWYPSVRLFRQSERGNWGAVFDEIAAELAHALGADTGFDEADGKGTTAVKSCRHGRMMFFTNDRYVGRSLDLYGEFSEGEPRLLDAIVRAGDTVVEVGANIGAHTLFLARRVGAEGRVYAFEPQRPLFQMLCGNLAMNELFNTHALHAASGREPGQIRVPSIDYAGAHNFAGLSLGGSGAGEQVPVVPVDSLNLSALRLLKVDVEGMEGDVLAGAAQTIRRLRPAIYVENDREENSPHLITQIRELGYRMWWHLPPLFSPNNHAGNKENVFPGLLSVNMLCLPAEFPHRVDTLREVSGPDDRWNVIPTAIALTCPVGGSSSSV
jgi:FkbM family methyltransferase